MKRALRHPAVGYVAPFAVFVGVMGVEHGLALPVQVGYPIRVALTLVVLLATRPDKMKMRPLHVVASIAVGIAVFAIWIAPDTLIGYRHHWLFENALTGKAGGTPSPALQSNIWFLFIHAAGSALLVPVIEELFWRGWLMRWLIDHNFECVPLGKYVPSAFWITAILFASEHGAYWEVGLAAGVIYNAWMVRTKSLGDCILAHAVTNAVLAAYVIGTGAWQYWL